MGSLGRNTGTSHHNHAQPNKYHNNIGLPKRSPSHVRRSSAAGIVQRPPLPPAIGTRSHSLDGLLDASNAADKSKVNISNCNVNEAEGASETLQLTPINGSADTLNQPINKSSSNNSCSTSSHRRSRSMDDLLDDREESLTVQQTITTDCDERSKSLENVYNNPCENATNSETTKDAMHNYKDVVSIGSVTSLTPTLPELNCGSESIIIDNTILKRDASIASGDDTASDSNSITASTCSRQDSTTSKNSEKKKSLLNRYAKKVKSFIKK